MGIGYIDRSADRARDGTGGFLWFDSQEALLSFLTEDLIWLASDFVLGDPFLVESALKRAALPMEEGSTTSESLRLALTSILGPVSRLEWIGQFGDLVSGEGEFSQETRRSFREHDKLRDDLDGDREVASSSPIEAEEVDEFVRALARWWR